jgi:hypothetical protein
MSADREQNMAAVDLLEAGSWSSSRSSPWFDIDQAGGLCNSSPAGPFSIGIC